MKRILIFIIVITACFYSYSAAAVAPSAQAYIEPDTAVSGFGTNYTYRINAEGEGMITRVNIPVPPGVASVVSVSSGMAGAIASYAAGEITVDYAQGWNVYSDPNFDVIAFSAVSDPGLKYYGSYFNGITDATGNTPDGFTQYVSVLTSTPTFTITPTITATPTITVTFLDTLTVTETHTVTPTITLTPTRTDTPDYTATQTPTGTPPTATNTPSSTRTVTSTRTATMTVTATATPTRTSTMTATLTVTRTATITVTITVKGLQVSAYQGGYTCASGQPSALAGVFGFTNIGGADEVISSLEIDFYGADGGPQECGDVISALYAVDQFSNTIASVSSPLGNSAALNFSPALNVPLQNIRRVYIYADIKSTTFSAVFGVSVNSSASVSAAVPVSALAGFEFPVKAPAVTIKRKTEVLEASYYDLMPPSVSTGQSGVFALMFSLNNPGGTDFSAALLSGLTLSVKDAASNPAAFDSAVSSVRITDGIREYCSAAASGPDTLYCGFSEPVTITAGAAKNIYVIADITSNTVNRASVFKIGVDAPDRLEMTEYHYGEKVTCYAAPAFSYPHFSSDVLIQSAAKNAKVSSLNAMPSYVSEGQQGVEAMKIVVTNQGDTSTASALITRLNVHAYDAFDNPISGPSAFAKISVTNSQGGFTYGSTQVFTGNKATVNFTSQVVVPAASSVTLSVRFDAAASYYPGQFKISFNSGDDIYAVDSNIFSQLAVSAEPGFPLQSSPASMQEKADSCAFSGFVPLAPAGVLKGQADVPLLLFEFTDMNGVLSAPTELTGITFTVRNSSGGAIAANTAFSQMYLVTSTGVTAAASAAGVGSKIYMGINPARVFAPGAFGAFTLYGSVPAGASAQDFVLSLESDSETGVRDSNSKTEAQKAFAPALPWQTQSCVIYASPATQVYAGAAGSINPLLVSMGQPSVRFMQISLYNPGGQGTAAILARGVTLSVRDAAGNIIPPSSALASASAANAATAAQYGEVNLSAASAAQPFYLPFASSQLFVPASVTVTAYINLNISASASVQEFMLRAESPLSFDAHSYPEGALSKLAAAGVVFPVDSRVTTISALAAEFRAGHSNLMPVSASRGETMIPALRVVFENPGSSPVSVTSLAAAFKGLSGAYTEASLAVSALHVAGASGVVIGSSAAVSGTHGVVNGFVINVPAGSTAYADILLDISATGSGIFYIELESPQDIGTLPVTSINPVTGNYFGNMKSSPLSIQGTGFAETAHAFPNPYNPLTGKAIIEYYLPEPSRVSVRVFTITGRQVREIAVNSGRPAGLNNTDIWDGRNRAGETVKAGIYIVQIEAEGASGEKRSAVRKLAVIK